MHQTGAVTPEIDISNLEIDISICGFAARKVSYFPKFSFTKSDHFLREKSIIMPDRELRHMRRTELVEIILALKQSEDQLRAENAALSAQLQERQIHIENAGSIAQAALELNKVFEAAQAAADDYVASVLAANKNTDAAASALRAQAEAEAQQILAQAQTEAANLKARTQQQCDAETEAAARKRAQTEADCKAMLARTQQEIQQRRAAFDRRASELLDGYHSTEFLPEERAK